MKKNINIWIVLWGFVGVVGIFSVIMDKMKESKDNEMASYTEKCYVINDEKCISFEQMKYIATKRMSSEEIDVFSEKCGLLLKGEKSSNSKFSSRYGFNGFSYHVMIINNNYYSFLCHSSADYINRLRSDIKAEDSSANEKNDNLCSDKIDGIIEMKMNWDLNDGSLLVAITAK